MPLNETSGNLTTDAFGGGVAAQVKYIENYFQTWLRTGTGASATITTGLDASTNKALVWTKSRSAATDHKLTDTVRGATKALISDTTGAQTTDTNGLTAFSSTGYTIGTDTNYNNSGETYVDWEFVATPKFFDVVTYTGTGSNTTIAHSLGSVPGCIMVKRTDTTGDWQVYHSSLANTEYLVLNTAAAKATGATRWNSTTPTSSVFSVGTDATVNANGGTYIAYLFAHNAGGFGLTGTDNVISCGSFTTDASGNATVNLGYEPQMVILKTSFGATSFWFMFDNMRGWSYSSAKSIFANRSNAESDQGANLMYPTATGFQVGGTGGYFLNPSTDQIYIAIRRGPMKVPTDATKVFSPVARTGTGATASITGLGFAPDFLISAARDIAYGMGFRDKLRGTNPMLVPSNTATEASYTDELLAYLNTGISIGADTSAGVINESGRSYINWLFGRAPSFMDVVCYTGTGSATTVSHNLQAVPELVINKNRNGTFGWYTCFNFTSTTYDQNTLSTTNAANIAVTYGTGGDMFSAKPTTTGLPLSAGANNLSAKTYVSYLFATCAGVSKVGSYTGNGTTQTINCGFTGGARFVLIKRTDSTGDWYTYDTARGMTTLTDPYLLLNSTATEAATLGSVTTVSTGFALNSTILAAINTNGATYLFFAVAQT